MTSLSEPLALPAAGAARPPSPRFIPREALGPVAAWQPRALLPSGAPGAPSAAAPSPAGEVAQAWRAQLAQARQAGYEQGHTAGLQALETFKHEHCAVVAPRLGELLRSFDAQLGALESQLAQGLADTAAQLARQVLRSELAAQPEQVADVARQALADMLLGARHISLHVHPEDLDFVAQGLHETLAARGARLLADAQVQRGGCRVESDLGLVDARIEQRWAQAAQALGSNLPWADAAPFCAAKA